LGGAAMATVDKADTEQLAVANSCCRRAQSARQEHPRSRILSTAIYDPLCSGGWTLRLSSCGTPGIARACLRWSWDVGLG
jgi:hypothetical protein